MMVMDQIFAETTVGSLFWTVGGYQVGENDQKVAKMAKLATRLAIFSLTPVAQLLRQWQKER